MSVPPWFGYAASRIVGKLVGDVIITRDEIEGLMAGLLCVDAPPAGTTDLTEWAKAHADTLGRRYASELARRKDRTAAYGAVRTLTLRREGHFVLVTLRVTDPHAEREEYKTRSAMSTGLQSFFAAMYNGPHEP